MSALDERNRVLGCDIGNGFGFVSVLENPAKDPLPLFAVDSMSKRGIPTSAYVCPPDGDRIEVYTNGKVAENTYQDSPQLVRSVKTLFSVGMLDIEGVSRPVDPYEVYAAIARDLILSAEAALKRDGKQPIYDVVFTFPAEFRDKPAILEKMENAIGSIVIDGHNINVVHRFPEPAAVAVDYLHYMQHIAPEEIRITRDDFTVLVYDLGHGTFDTAVVTAHSNQTPEMVHTTQGLPIGGRNFDLAMETIIKAKLKEEHDYEPRGRIREGNIHRLAVEAKENLSNPGVTSDEVYVDDNDGGFYTVEITRKEFEDHTRPLIDQTLELVQQLLDAAEAKGTEIDAVVLSGGASRMPMVKEALEELVEGKYPVLHHRPSEAVSFGAARVASIAVKQLTDRCYGLWLPDDNIKGRVEFVIPCKRSLPVTSEPVKIVSHEPRVEVSVYCLKEKNKDVDHTSNIRGECDNVHIFHFDVQPGSACTAKVSILENYRVQVDLDTDKGEHLSKTTADF